MNYLSKKRRKRSKKMYGGRSYDELDPKEKKKADELVAGIASLSHQAVNLWMAGAVKNATELRIIQIDKAILKQKLVVMGLREAEIDHLVKKSPERKEAAARGRAVFMTKVSKGEEISHQQAQEADEMIQLNDAAMASMAMEAHEQARAKAKEREATRAAKAEAAETRARNREATKRAKAKIREATRAAKAEAQRHEPGSEWDASPELITRWQPDLHISARGGAAGQ
jgi:hypothetical protein